MHYVKRLQLHRFCLVTCKISNVYVGNPCVKAYCIFRSDYNLGQQ